MIVFRLGLSAIDNGIDTFGDSFHDVSFVFVHNLLFFRFDGAMIERKCARELHGLVFHIITQLPQWLPSPSLSKCPKYMVCIHHLVLR